MRFCFAPTIFKTLALVILADTAAAAADVCARSRDMVAALERSLGTKCSDIYDDQLSSIERFSISTAQLQPGDFKGMNPFYLELTAPLAGFKLEKELESMTQLIRLKINTDIFIQQILPYSPYLEAVSISATRMHLDERVLERVRSIDDIYISSAEDMKMDLTMEGNPFLRLQGYTKISFTGDFVNFNTLKNHLEFSSPVTLSFYAATLSHLDSDLFTSPHIASVQIASSYLILGNTAPFRNLRGKLGIGFSRVEAETVEQFVRNIQIPSLSLYKTEIEIASPGTPAPTPY